jgi:hypothetical protein
MSALRPDWQTISMFLRTQVDSGWKLKSALDAVPPVCRCREMEDLYFQWTGRAIHQVGSPTSDDQNT